MNNNLYNRIMKKLKKDSPSQFLYRIGRFLIFIFFSNYIKFKDCVRFKLIKLNSKKRIVIKKILDNKMYLDLKDEGLSKDLFLHGIREPFATKIVQQELKRGDVVVDIGANIGYYVLLESKLIGREGKIYAIEPVSQSFELLKKNIELNKIKNAETFNLAIGGEKKIDNIYLSNNLNLSTMRKDNIRKPIIGKERIKVVTLDDFLKNKIHPNFIRMDVEGYEIEIIKGMQKILKANQPLKIFMEVHSHILKEKVISLIDTLKKHNFQVKILIREPKITHNQGLFKKVFNFFSRKMNSIGIGYIKIDMEGLKRILTREDFAPEVFFERK